MLNIKTSDSSASKAQEYMEKLNKSALENGVDKLSLDEIIFEIDSYRNEKKNAAENGSYNEQDTVERIPNNDTIEAIEEVRSIKKCKNYGKTYTDVDDMIKELLD